MTDIHYETLNHALIRALPELLDEPEWDWAMSEGPTALYADILVPYLRHALAHADAHQDVLTRAFEFLEVLATHEDSYVEKVVVLSVIAPLQSHSTAIEVARAWMRPMTLQLLSG